MIQSLPPFRVPLGGSLRRLAAGLVLTVSFVLPAIAQTADRPLPAREIIERLAGRGYDRISRPRFDGATYRVEAISPQGMRMRLAVDAYSGRILQRDWAEMDDDDEEEELVRPRERATGSLGDIPFGEPRDLGLIPPRDVPSGPRREEFVGRSAAEPPLADVPAPRLNGEAVVPPPAAVSVSPLAPPPQASPAPVRRSPPVANGRESLPSPAPAPVIAQPPPGAIKDDRAHQPQSAPQQARQREPQAAKPVVAAPKTPVTTGTVASAPLTPAAQPTTAIPAPAASASTPAPAAVKQAEPVKLPPQREAAAPAERGTVRVIGGVTSVPGRGEGKTTVE
jgi:hypothetical protein